MTRPFLAAACAALMLLAAPVRADLAAALAASAREDWAAARAAAQGEIEADIIEWQRLRDGEAEQDWDAYRRFLARRPDWPGLPLLAEKGERWIPRGADPGAVLEYFAAREPRTGRGALRLAAALEATGEGTRAQAVIVAAWRTMLLDDEERQAFLDRHGDLVAPHHWARLDHLLWEGAAINARAMLPLVGEPERRLAEARIGLREQVDGVNALIERVPAALAGDPGLAFERFLWRARKGREADAIALALERSESAESLGRPEAWAERRASLARTALREGRAREAYRLASSHRLTEGSAYADLEWLSGYAALRGLDDPARALEHFRAMRVAVATPISLGRAGYWEGRAREAAGDAAGAQAAYEFAGEYQSGFYGQLAAEKAGMPMDGVWATGGPAFPDWRGASFAGSSVLAAARALLAAGDRPQGVRFLLHLAEGLDATGLGQLSEMALELGEDYAAVAISKAAAERNVILPRAYFPVSELAKAHFEVPAELVLSIARRESEFNPAAVSRAGALGLMQLMPGTAQDMARALGVAYERGRLTRDPAYNAQLGSAYLAKLAGEFGSNPILLAVGYNAGPGRVRSWVAERGHPGAPDVDAVDWIEAIPFTETRTYVQRVAESLPLYRARLRGETAPLTLRREIGRP